MKPEKLAYTVPVAIEVSSQPRTAIYAAIKSGDLIARKRGFRTIILAADLKHWLEAMPRLDTRRSA